ncbi:MAG: hypothetical protein ABR579_01480 [Actinomycetota bacterium]
MADPVWENGIGTALRGVAASIDFGPEPDLVPKVSAAIATARVAPARPALRRLVPSFALAVIVAVTLAAGIPGPRHAIARALGIGGIKIEFVKGPLATPTPATNLFLGSKTTLTEAQAQVRFQVSVPDADLVGAPSNVYLSAFPPGGRVSLIYEPSDELPEAAETGLGMLVTEFGADINPDFVKKLISSGATITGAFVNGAQAYWIEGAHYYMYMDAKGEVRQDTLRLSSNALIWERDGVTLRIEGSFSKARALQIARSMH